MQERTFLVALIALMTLLASLALAGYLLLDQTSQNWVNGLDNKATIEIARTEDNNNPYESATKLQKEVQDLDFVSSATLMEAEGSSKTHRTMVRKERH